MQCGGYTASEFGVAIQSHVQDLKSFAVYENDVYPSAVVYRDYKAPPSQTISTNEITPHRAILQKRVYSKHECKLRTITYFLFEFRDKSRLGTLF